MIKPADAVAGGGEEVGGPGREWQAADSNGRARRPGQPGSPFSSGRQPDGLKRIEDDPFVCS